MKGDIKPVYFLADEVEDVMAGQKTTFRRTDGLEDVNEFAGDMKFNAAVKVVQGAHAVFCFEHKTGYEVPGACPWGTEGGRTRRYWIGEGGRVVRLADVGE